ncbi:AcrR family transcriptional regulator [Paeniglutamicibacter psychrophenolicus]|nr:AcrR family transcriptional regulator [Paeniglutamicibacter psychrophenolicus]
MGTGPASLYRYLRSHDELVELMVDTVSGEYDLGPSGETPRDQLLALARQGRSIMHRHPWLAALLPTRPSMGPSTLRYLERALSAMESIDMPGPSKLQTVAMLTALTSAFVQNELSQPGNSGSDNGAANDRLEYLSEAVWSGNYPRLAGALAGGHEPETPDDMFTGIIVDYLAGAGLR